MQFKLKARHSNDSAGKGIGGYGVAAKPPHHTPALKCKDCLSSYMA
jgi:hypothetical protein